MKFRKPLQVPKVVSQKTRVSKYENSIENHFHIRSSKMTNGQLGDNNNKNKNNNSNGVESLQSLHIS